MAIGPPNVEVTCDRCGKKPSFKIKGPGDAIAQGWSRFEMLREDGETIDFVTACRECLTEVEEAGLWPKPSPSPSGRGGG